MTPKKKKKLISDAQDGCQARDHCSDRVSTLIGRKQLSTSDQMSGHFPAVFVVTEPGILISYITLHVKPPDILSQNNPKQVV